MKGVKGEGSTFLIHLYKNILEYRFKKFLYRFEKYPLHPLHPFKPLIGVKMSAKSEGSTEGSGGSTINQFNNPNSV